MATSRSTPPQPRSEPFKVVYRRPLRPAPFPSRSLARLCRPALAPAAQRRRKGSKTAANAERKQADDDAAAEAAAAYLPIASLFPAAGSPLRSGSTPGAPLQGEGNNRERRAGGRRADEKWDELDDDGVMDESDKQLLRELQHSLDGGSDDDGCNTDDERAARRAAAERAAARDAANGAANQREPAPAADAMAFSAAHGKRPGREARKRSQRRAAAAAAPAAAAQPSAKPGARIIWDRKAVRTADGRALAEDTAVLTVELQPVRAIREVDMSDESGAADTEAKAMLDEANAAIDDATVRRNLLVSQLARLTAAQGQQGTIWTAALNALAAGLGKPSDALKAAIAVLTQREQKPTAVDAYILQTAPRDAPSDEELRTLRVGGRKRLLVHTRQEALSATVSLSLRFASAEARTKAEAALRTLFDAAQLTMHADIYPDVRPGSESSPAKSCRIAFRIVDEADVYDSYDERHARLTTLMEALGVPSNAYAVHSLMAGKDGRRIELNVTYANEVRLARELHKQNRQVTVYGQRALPCHSCAGAKCGGRWTNSNARRCDPCNEAARAAATELATTRQPKLTDRRSYCFGCGRQHDAAGMKACTERSLACMSCDSHVHTTLRCAKLKPQWLPLTEFHQLHPPAPTNAARAAQRAAAAAPAAAPIENVWAARQQAAASAAAAAPTTAPAEPDRSVLARPPPAPQRAIAAAAPAAAAAAPEPAAPSVSQEQQLTALMRREMATFEQRIAAQESKMRQLEETLGSINAKLDALTPDKLNALMMSAFRAAMGQPQLDRIDALAARTDRAAAEMAKAHRTRRSRGTPAKANRRSADAIQTDSTDEATEDDSAGSKRRKRKDTPENVAALIASITPTLTRIAHSQHRQQMAPLPFSLDESSAHSR